MNSSVVCPDAHYHRRNYVFLKSGRGSFPKCVVGYYRSGQPPTHRLHCCSCSGARPQLGEEATDVSRDRPVANAQRYRDLLVSLLGGQELDYFLLPAAELTLASHRLGLAHRRVRAWIV